MFINARNSVRGRKQVWNVPQWSAQMNPKTLSTLATVLLVAAVYGLFFAHALLGTGPVTVGIQVAAFF